MFGRYELLERINIGGMAETIKARDTGAPGRPIVAVKRVLPHLADDKQYLTMFGDEARTLARLTHDNIIRTLDVGSAEGIPYIALEFVHGQDARLLLHRARRDDARIPLPIACYIVAQVARGLHFAHELTDEQNVSLALVHRDVSLQNMLLSYDGDVKLIDFGIARVEDNVDQTDHGIVKGKFGYMSPEQVKGEPLDRRSDLFSLGICLWELLTRERMFPGKSTPELLRRIRDAQIDAPRTLDPELPEALDRLVMRALQRDPADRFATADEFRRALLAFMNESGNECGPAELASYVRTAFAAELRRQPSPDVLVSEVARKFDEESGLSAFENVDPVSAVSTLEAQVVAFQSEPPYSEPPFPTEPPERPRRLHAPPGRPSVPPMRPRRSSVPPSFADGRELVPRRRVVTPAPAVRAPPRMGFSAALDARPEPAAAAGPVEPPAFGPQPLPEETSRGDQTDPVLSLARSTGAGGSALAWGTAATVAIGAVIALVLYFGRATKPGTLQIVTRPADVVVTVDGTRLAADRSPFVITGLDPDVRHEVVVGKLGHREWRTELVLRPGQVLALPEVALQPVDRFATEDAPRP
jgi:serine/threonine protein kinase